MLWACLEVTARTLGSFRGEAGLVVAAIVVVAAVLVEHTLSPGARTRAWTRLGLHRPQLRASLWAIGFGVGLLGFFPVFAIAVDTTLTVRSDAPWLALGMFAQGGIAEEVVFRGFLFRRFREGRSFWRAAGLAAIPFMAVHVLLFVTLGPLVALAALIVSLSMTFPLAWLFERSGASIWPPALVHAVVQGAIKVVDADRFQVLAVAWMALSATLPWLFFAVLPAARDRDAPNEGTL